MFCCPVYDLLFRKMSSIYEREGRIFCSKKQNVMKQNVMKYLTTATVFWVSCKPVWLNTWTLNQLVN